MKLTEDVAKAWLRDGGLPVPEGRAASGAADARRAADELGGAVVVKALVAAGRRGKAGAVQFAESADAALLVAERICALTVAGQAVDRLYVERAITIASELYLSFVFGSLGPQLVVSRFGGVDIEQTSTSDPAAIVTRNVDPRRGLMTWEAAEAWDRAGVPSVMLPILASMSVRLYQRFKDADGLMLEINPLVVTPENTLAIVGTMMEVDDNALYRHPEWEELAGDEAGPGGRPLNSRERAVKAADRRFPGGAIRYTELDGDIGLLVSGGGAGLYQHDLMVDAGGRPANHSDLSPTPSPDKPAAILEAIFSNPNVRGLLIGYNFLQLAPCDLVIRALLMAIDRCNVDPRKFPIVVRVFGPREREARQMAAEVSGLRYLAHGASLADGVREILTATKRVPGAKQ